MQNSPGTLWSGYAILDVKSTASAHRNNFRSCVNYDYDLSAAMYQEGFFQLSGEKIDFVFLACEKEAPHLCTLQGERRNDGQRLCKVSSGSSDHGRMHSLGQVGGKFHMFWLNG